MVALNPSRVDAAQAVVDSVRRADAGVAQLLRASDELCFVIADAINQLQQAFDHAPIELDYFEDSEDERPEPHVHVTVLPPWTFVRAHETLDRFDEAWLLENQNRAGGRFAVAVHPTG